MPHVPDHIRRRYLTGKCAALAREMHLATGRPLLGLFDADGELHHAMIADPDPDFAWDIRGRIRVVDAAEGSFVDEAKAVPIGIGALEAQFGAFDTFDLLEASRVIRAHFREDPLWPGEGDTFVVPGTGFNPPPGLRELYTQGSCHVFALAALDVLSCSLRPAGLRLVLDLDEVAWESEYDPDDALHAVVHVYAVFEVEDGLVAVDVLGARPLEQAVAECEEMFCVGNAGVEDLRDPADILPWIDTEEDGGRPLHALTCLAFDEARHELRRLCLGPTDPSPAP